MRFATRANGQPDGRLHLVDRTNTHAVQAHAATTLQAVLDDWDALAPALEAEYAALNAGDASNTIPFATAGWLAPLPRAWQWLDASAFASHGELMQQVFGFSAVHPTGAPLMYQGVSDRFLGPEEDVPFREVADQIDFEGEFGIVTDAVPLGITAAGARGHIRLLVQINDWSLRRLGPIEMKTGFGVIQCKPRSTMAPIAVTPDEIGAQWGDCRIALPLEVDYNGERFGRANGATMSVGFDTLVEHAAYSRDLVAGTVIGSGTVSNSNFREVGSSCISERRAIEMQDTGQPATGFMHYGDTVRMECRTSVGEPLFGAINQRVVPIA
jgi:fumarylacetoacetate (FAA) hydrolase